MKREVFRSPSLQLLVNRFFDRAHLFDPSFLPRKHLLYVRDLDAIYLYKDGVYKEFNTTYDFPRFLLKFLEHETNPASFTPSPSDPERSIDGYLPLHASVSITMDILKNMIKTIPMELPIDRVVDSMFSPYITFSDNMVLNLGDPTFPITPASPEIFSFFKVNFPSSVLGGEAAEVIKQHAPRFLRLLDETTVLHYWEGVEHTYQRPHDQDVLDTIKAEGFAPDEALQDFLQEVFGYALLDGISSHAAFFFHGEGQNGKSRLLNLLRSFFPKELVSFLRISDFSSEFKASMLIGKKLNISNEEESKNIRLDVLKNIISGEPMPANRKFRDAISFVPTAKLFLSTNDLPTFERIDFALKRRLHIISFLRVVPDHLKDVFLDEKLNKELAGVLRWAIEGAKRFQQRGSKFDPPEVTKAAFNEMVEDRFPAIRFFKEFYEITDDENDTVTSQAMYTQYRSWSIANGYSNPMNERNFGKQIYSLDKRIKRVRVNSPSPGNIADRPWARTNIKRIIGTDPLPIL